MSQTDQHTLNELCVLADLPIRTVRYYVQNGLVDRPDGETRAARYGARHVEQVLLIKKWTAAGVSLERVRELLHGQEAPVAARPRKAGSVEVCSHLYVADGLEIIIEPGRAQMTPEQVRQFTRGVIALYSSVTEASTSEVAQDPTNSAVTHEEGNKK
jgi:DNA-binding transcriptional MerR regulator